MIICCLHIFSISIGTCIRCTFLKNVIAIRLIPEKNIIRQYWIEKECHASKLLFYIVYKLPRRYYAYSLRDNICVTYFM